MYKKEPRRKAPIFSSYAIAKTKSNLLNSPSKVIPGNSTSTLNIL